MENSTDRNKCEICGRRQKHAIRCHGHSYCNKHYRQIKKFGHVLDSNPRTTMDRNEIRIVDGIAFIDLYDKDCNVVATAKVDPEDLDKVRHVKWKLSKNGYAMNSPKFKGGSVHMSRLVLGVDGFVDHVNHDTLDNRRSNLRLVTKSQNAMNSLKSKGVSRLKDGRYYAHIKMGGLMLNLGVYVHEEEALLARWYAEEMLFGEYRAKKEKPSVSEQRDQSIFQYVSGRCRDYNRRRSQSKSMEGAQGIVQSLEAARRPSVNTGKPGVDKVHREPVLEPGQDAGDKGAYAASVKGGV